MVSCVIHGTTRGVGEEKHDDEKNICSAGARRYVCSQRRPVRMRGRDDKVSVCGVEEAYSAGTSEGGEAVSAESADGETVFSGGTGSTEPGWTS